MEFIDLLMFISYIVIKDKMLYLIVMYVFN